MNQITRISQLLSHAQKHNYAIGGFNYDNALILRGIVAAAEETKRHVFVMCTQSASEGMDYDYALANAIVAAKQSKYVISHWDHGFDYSLAKKVVKDGWQSVMYDGSKLNFKENCKNTKKFISIAEKYQVWTECEIGSIGGKEDEDLQQLKKLTNFSDAIKFSLFVKARMMGIAVGNEHGIYKQKPHLDFQLIKNVAERLKDKTFLVLHGGSGIDDYQIIKAIKAGMVKINIGTDLKIAYANSVRNWFLKNPNNFDTKKYHNEAIAAVKKVAIYKINLFSKYS